MCAYNGVYIYTNTYIPKRVAKHRRDSFCIILFIDPYRCEIAKCAYGYMYQCMYVWIFDQAHVIYLLIYSLYINVMNVCCVHLCSHSQICTDTYTIYIIRISAICTYSCVVHMPCMYIVKYISCLNKCTHTMPVMHISYHMFVY